mmetsp:Transcript_82375/g.143165  ORF Transcript_82375/g.143165 Transcript_82375/m.143165 type:complete len:117 (+) Transcript_82375:363-713(+)
MHRCEGQELSGCSAPGGKSLQDPASHLQSREAHRCETHGSCPAAPLPPDMQEIASQLRQHSLTSLVSGCTYFGSSACKLQPLKPGSTLNPSTVHRIRQLRAEAPAPGASSCRAPAA